MTDKEKKYLSDILNSISYILSFTSETNSFEDYSKNFLVKSPVERHFGIIGEAVNKFLKEHPSNTLANSKEIIGLRNWLIHSYDNVDDRVIWNILKEHIHPLRNEVTI